MRRIVWCVVLLGLTLVALLCAFGEVGLGRTSQAIAALLFLAVCPGMALVGMTGIDDPLVEVVLAMAISLSIALCGALAMVYLESWYPAVLFAILAATTVLGVACTVIMLSRQEQ